MSLPLHPQTIQLITHLSQHLPQSLLLSGPPGVGMKSIANQIADNELLAYIYPKNTKGEPDEQGTISVETIRELHTRTRGKHTGRQVVVIDLAERMNTSSQSAFLKLLEEPNSSIHFILLSHYPEQLKDTILSRVQQHTIPPITKEQTADFIKTLGISDPKKIAQLQFIAGGLPELLLRLSHDDELFSRRAAIVTDARTLLQGSGYEKLLIAQQYHTNRDDAILLIDAALMIARRTLSSKPQEALLLQMTSLLKAMERLRANGNIRLTLAAATLS